jgi:hypothetical protein
MIMPEERNMPSGSGKRSHLPRTVRSINTAIALVLFGLSIYHYTQPNQAWRSGTTELVSALALLTAAYLVSHVKAIVINLIIVVPVITLGIRHLIHGGGWRSGIADLFFAVLLIAAAYIIYRDRGKHKLSS